MEDFRNEVRAPGKLDTSDIPGKRMNIPCAFPEGRTGTFDLYWPSEGDGPFPVIVSVASGAWFYGTPSTAHLGRQVHVSTARGYAFVSMACTSSRDLKYPGQVREIRCLLRYLQAHAEELNLDCRFIAFLSSSSGAHLSLMTALTEGDPGCDIENPPGPCPRISAVVAVYPCCRLNASVEEYQAEGLEPATLRSGPDCAESVLMGTEDIMAHPDLIRAGSPTMQIREGAPPVFLLHGTGDRVLLWTLTREFAERYRQLNGPEKVQTRFVQRAGHSDPCFKSEKACMEMLDFLDRVRTGQVPCPPELQGCDMPVPYPGF